MKQHLRILFLSFRELCAQETIKKEGMQQTLLSDLRVEVYSCSMYFSSPAQGWIMLLVSLKRKLLSTLIINAGNKSHPDHNQVNTFFLLAKNSDTLQWQELKPQLFCAHITALPGASIRPSPHFGKSSHQFVPAPGLCQNRQRAQQTSLLTSPHQSLI